MPLNASNNEFETEVLTHLTQLGTKMNMLVSDDGETGAVPRLQKDMKAVERKIWYFSGAALGIGGFIHFVFDVFHSFRGR